MMNFISKDAEMVQLLENMSNLLAPAFEDDSNLNASDLIHQLSQQAAQLKQSLKNYQDNYFSYEFYNAACDLIEIMTSLRLQKAWRNSVRNVNGMAVFDEVMSAIKSAIFRHEAFADPIYQEDTATIIQSDQIAAAQAKIEAATEKASAATAATEKANLAAAKLLESMQQEQKKTGGTLDTDSIDQSLKITIELCARNAAAVIAADAVAAAIAAYEDLVDQTQK